jgi:hypothetical protein
VQNLCKSCGFLRTWRTDLANVKPWALGDYPGGLFNIHGASVDQEGNLYVAEVAKRAGAEIPSPARRES